MKKPKSIKINLQLPYLVGIEGVWEPDDNERKAAWELYVELITRISVVELDGKEGLIREALTSLHSLFDTTRKVLRSYGPDIAKPKGKGDISLGILSVAMLNAGIRPFLSKWHPILLDYEKKKPLDLSPTEHEFRWKKGKECRDELKFLTQSMNNYCDYLSQVAGVPKIHEIVVKTQV